MKYYRGLLGMDASYLFLTWDTLTRTFHAHKSTRNGALNQEGGLLNGLEMCFQSRRADSFVEAFLARNHILNVAYSGEALSSERASYGYLAQIWRGNSNGALSALNKWLLNVEL